MKRALEQLKREGSIALWHDYRLGHALDLSGNGNDGTLVNSPWFDRNGLNTDYLGNQAVQVAHSSSININTLTVVGLIVTRRISPDRSNLPQLARKNTAAGLSWSIRLNDGSDNIEIDASGSGAWNLSRSFSGVAYIGCNMESGRSDTGCYIDGIVDDAALNTPLTIVNTTADLFIANRYLLDRGLGRTLSSLIIFNKLLSATEHAEVYGDLMKVRRGIVI